MKRYFVDLYSLLAANPIEFYEGHVTTRVTFVLRTYSSSNRDFYLTVYLVTVAANDQAKKLYRALSPSATFPPPLFDLSSQRAQKLGTSLITLPSKAKLSLYLSLR